MVVIGLRVYLFVCLVSLLILCVYGLMCFVDFYCGWRCVMVFVAVCCLLVGCLIVLLCLLVWCGFTFVWLLIALVFAVMVFTIVVWLLVRLLDCLL